MTVLGRGLRQSFVWHDRSWLARPCAAFGLLVPLAAAGQALPEPADREPELEVVIVTARKAEEDVLTVPMSIQVLPRDRLDATDPANLYELQFDVPGLVAANVGMNGAGIALRGVTDETGQSLAVVPHFNGVYLGRSTLALSRVFDLERIEVLKGPQSALYGRNSTGGSINLVTRAPESEFSSSLETAIGSFDTVRVQGHVNFATERVWMRFAGIASGGDGYIRNSADDRVFAEEDYGAFRASMQALPTQALTIKVTAQHGSDDGGSDELWLPNRAYLADPGDIRLASVTLANPYLAIDDDLLSIELKREFAKGTLTSVTGYARDRVRDMDDCGGGPLPPGCVRSYQPRTYVQNSQELRYASSGSDRYDWMVGLYFLDADELSNFRLSVPGPGVLNDYSAVYEQRASALFGSASYRLGQRASLTGGLRFSHDMSRATNSGLGIHDSPTRATNQESWDNTSWHVDYEFAPTDHTLYYASVATGFKAGGTADDRLPNGEFDDHDPEELTAYEAGVKLRVPDRRWTLAGSAFYYDIRDLQVTSFAVVANAPVFAIENAADARIRGLDLSTELRLTERLSFSGGLVWLPTREFVDFTSTSTGGVLSGNELSRAPEWTPSLSIGYEKPIRDMVLSVRADYAYRSAFFFTKENEPSSAQEAFGLLNLFVDLDSNDGHWYVFASARNLLDTDYFTQAFIQSSPGLPANYELGFGLRF